MMFERLFAPFVIGLVVVCFGCGPSVNSVDLMSDEDSGGKVDANDSVGDLNAPDGAVLLDALDSGDVADVLVDSVDVMVDEVPDNLADDEMKFDVPMDEDLGGDNDLVETDLVDTTDAVDSDANDGCDAEDILDISDGSIPDDTSADTTVACTPVVAHELCYGPGTLQVPDLKVFLPGEEALVSTYAAICCNPVFEFTVPDLNVTTVVLVAEMVYESCDSYWTVSESELCGDTLSAAVEFNVDPTCDLGFIACTLIQLDARATNFVLKP